MKAENGYDELQKAEEKWIKDVFDAAKLNATGVCYLSYKNVNGQFDLFKNYYIY